MVSVMVEATGTTTWVIVVELTALPAWLALARADRHGLIEREVLPVTQRYPEIRLRWVDVEAFNAECSDVLIAETAELRTWNRLFEALRDTALFAVPYFRLERILPGLQDGYRDLGEDGS